MTTVDRFPNFISGIITESGAATFTTARVNTPIPRIGSLSRRGRSTVMELLWMDVVSNVDMDAGNETWTFQMTIGSAPSAILGWNDPRVFAHKFLNMQLLTSGATISEFPLRYSFQDKNGFGYLLAADAFNVSVAGVNTGAASANSWKLFYRFIDITTDEYVGIVQSQQT